MNKNVIKKLYSEVEVNLASVDEFYRGVEVPKVLADEATKSMDMYKKYLEAAKSTVSEGIKESDKSFMVGMKLEDQFKDLGIQAPAKFTEALKELREAYNKLNKFRQELK